MEQLGLYIHYPQCAKRCWYCDFHSGTDRRGDGYWLEFYRKGLEMFPPGRPLSSVYFGGGTPSLMRPETIAEILKPLNLAGNCEITLELNPATASKAKMRGFAAAGVNRVSIGVQSLDNAQLLALGRIHTARQARTALDNAMQLFPRVSADFIYALEGQAIAQWEKQLAHINSLGLSHVSLYQMTPQQHGEDAAAGFFLATQDGISLPRYEVSNHAAPGHESRHNLLYWQGGDFIGIGPSAHGRIGLIATYCDLEGNYTQEEIAPDDRLREKILMGLRTEYGAENCRLINQTRLDDMVSAGLARIRGGRIVLTTHGLLVCDAVAAALIL